LAEGGIGAALRDQAQRSPLPVRVEIESVGRYGQETEVAVYFSALEALQNVAKYAAASQAVVPVAHTNGTLTFALAADRAGFGPASTGYGTGLRGMADRLEAIGGSLDVASAPGTGTRVVGRVPAMALEAP